MNLSVLSSSLMPLLQTEISAALDKGEAKFSEQLQSFTAATTASPLSPDASALATDLATQIQNLIADTLARYRNEAAADTTVLADGTPVMDTGLDSATTAIQASSTSARVAAPAATAVTPAVTAAASAITGTSQSALLQSIGERGRGLLAQMPASTFYREEAPRLLAEAVDAGEITRGQAHAAQILYGLQTDLTNAQNAVRLGQRGLDQAIALRSASWYGDPARAARLESRIQALTDSLAQSQNQVDRLTPRIDNLTAKAGAAADLFSPV